MDDAERRFRDCVDRFKRDLTTIIFQSIDSMVLEAEQRAPNQAISPPARVSSSEEAKASGSKRKQRNQRRAPSSQRIPEKGEARKRRGAKPSDLALGVQREFHLELAKVLPATKSKPARVRADSILGAELAHGLDASSTGAAADSDGVSSTNGGSVHADAKSGDAAAKLVSNASAARFRPSSKPPSERPLFVHRRARDGQIHALRRVREAAPAEGNASSADSGR